MMTDPIADMLTRIRNAVRVERPSVDMPTSKVKRGLAEVLKREGYIWDWKEIDGEPVAQLRIVLKYGNNGERVIRHLKRVSKPGSRVYRGAARLNLDLEHQPRRDQRSRGPAAKFRRRSIVRIVVRRRLWCGRLARFGSRPAGVDVPRLRHNFGQCKLRSTRNVSDR
jgi:small subunit ribosomal protein S8